MTNEICEIAKKGFKNTFAFLEINVEFLTHNYKINCFVIFPSSYGLQLQ
jgi:hypothetical protein